MARVILISMLSAYLVSFNCLGATANDKRSEVPDPEAVKAYRDYWSALEEYEAHAAAKGSSKLQAIYDRINREEIEKKNIRLREQIEFLKNASLKYKRHLDEFPDASNRQYVILNYARMVDRIAGIESEISSEKADDLRREVLGRLRDFEVEFPDASMIDEISALRAVLLEKTGLSNEALTVWQTIAGRSRMNQSVLAANIASGDYAFERVEYAKALTYYSRAKEIVTVLRNQAENRKTAIKASARVYYRVGWAAYKSGDLNKTITAAAALLEPHLDIFSDKERRAIQRDAAELLGDALYEERDTSRMRQILSRPALGLIAANSGLRIVKRFGSGKEFRKLAEFGSFLLEKFPNAAEVPWLLDLTATGYEQSGNLSEAMRIRSRIVNLLPENSLWRSINRENIEVNAALQEIGLNLAIKSGAWFYEEGLQSGNQAAYKMSASIYDTLLHAFPGDVRTNEWRLRIANCNYFQNNLSEARKLYVQLKSDYALDRRLLEITSYQDVLAAERIWKDAIAKAATEGKKPLDDQESKNALKQLIASIDDFNNRFPGQARSNELLLVGASAFRDQGLLVDAEKYWQRVLIANPTPSQRSLAIRGLVQSELMTSPHAEVIAVVSKFLKLEDWEKLGKGLQQEMEGILSSAAIDEGSRLNQDGRVLDAGSLLVQTAVENPGLPQREKLLRDGGYLLALGGAWGEAGRVSHDYIKAGMKEYVADMRYLAARSDEYLLKLADAGRQFLEFARQYPSHSRAGAALERAEKFSVASENLDAAAIAAAEIARRSEKREDKLRALRRAVEYAEKNRAWSSARKYAAEMLKSSRDLSERFDSQFVIGKIAINSGDVQQGIDNLEILARRIEQDRFDLGDSFSSLSGAVNLFLGEHAYTQFKAIRIDSKDPDVAMALTRKLRIFDDVMMRLDRAAVSGDKNSAPIARFKAGSAAEMMAGDIVKSGRAGVDLKARENAARLKLLAKNYFSANLMAARKHPSAYRENEWVMRSGLKLEPANVKLKSDVLSDQIPLSAEPDLPSQWRL